MDKGVLCRSEGLPLRDIGSLRTLVGGWGWLGVFRRRRRRRRRRCRWAQDRGPWPGCIQLLEIVAPRPTKTHKN